MSVPTISPLAAALRAQLMPDVELILAGLNPVPLASDKPGATGTRDAAATAQPQTETAPQKAPPPPAVQALDTARQTDAGRQAGLGPLLADLEQAVKTQILPPQVRAAAEKVLALQTPIEAPVTPQTIKAAVARSGLFLEPRLAQGRAPPPDLKSALLVLRQVLRAAVPAPETATAATATQPAGPRPDAPPPQTAPSGLARTYAPPSPAFLAETGRQTPVSTEVRQPAAQPQTATPQSATSPTATPQSVTPQNLVAQSLAPQTLTPQAAAPQTAPPAIATPPVPTAAGPVPAPATAPAIQAAAPLSPLTPLTPLTPEPLHTAPGALSPPTQPTPETLRPQPHALAIPTPLAPPPIEVETAELPLTAPAAHAVASPDKAAPPAQPDPAPPPPMKGAPPQAQKAAHASIAADADPAAMVRHLERATSGAIARTELLQLASLPDAPRADGAADRTNSWLFEIPLATAQGPAVAQFEIEKDAQGLGSAAEAACWRTRFSIDVEPAGRVHALVVMAGGNTTVTLWAERLGTVERLRLSQADLAGTLEAEVAVYPGAPSTPRPPPGRFLDASS